MKIGAIILAAGEGKRMGIPKAILKIGNRYLADIQYETLLNCNIEEVSIIIGAQADYIMCNLLHKESCIINKDYTRGQFSSLICGINSLKNSDGILIMPVDNYPQNCETIKKIIDKFNDRFDATIPVFNGRKGHPVIISKHFAELLLSKDISNSRLDYLLKEANVNLIEVDSSVILNNLNYPVN